MKKKKLLSLTSILLLLSLVGSLFFTVPVAADADAWDGVSMTMPTKGSGSSGDPYLIENAEHLAWLSWAVKTVEGAKELLGDNADVKSRKVFTGLYFKQTADIDLNNKAFTPIGVKQATEDYTTRIAFGGNYDGDNHVIKNAVITQNVQIIQEDYSEAYVTGLFGFVSGGSVKNVHVKNIKVGQSVPEAIMLSKSFDDIISGTVVGLAIASSITNCTTDENCEAHGVYAGGIVGVAIDRTTITYCENNALVVGHSGAGGIVGAFEGTIDYCVNNANISAISFKRWSGVGGIAGVYTNASAQQNSISNSANHGAMSVIEKKGGSAENHRAALGGIIGNDNSGDKGSVAYKNLFNLATHFDATFTTSGNDDVLAASGGIMGLAEDTAANRESTTAYVNLWSVAGTTTENHFGVKTFERVWSNVDDTPNYYSFAGITSGRNTIEQMAKALGIEASNYYNPGWRDLVDAAFATCYYGKTASEIRENAIYQNIISSVGYVEPDDGEGDLPGGSGSETPEEVIELKGSGTEGDPYLVENAEHLALLSEKVASGMGFAGKYFLQTGDIDLNNAAFTPIGTVFVNSVYSGSSETMIAGAPYVDDILTFAFEGIYNGDGYAIKNAKITSAKTEDVTKDFRTAVDTVYAAGIFGVTVGATIQNVHAENIVVGTLDKTGGALKNRRYLFRRRSGCHRRSWL